MATKLIDPVYANTGVRAAPIRVAPAIPQRRVYGSVWVSMGTGEGRYLPAEQAREMAMAILDALAADRDARAEGGGRGGGSEVVRRR